ncbi:MAG: hypothetical protein HY725_20725 [Candidatus Rokubacteria bacterium]|nr:hypothetical protein [Candidatus Rokubacteria bacterium]
MFIGRPSSFSPLTRPSPPALAALVLGLTLSLAPPVGAGLADRVGATFALMAQEFVTAFPGVEGLVVAREGDLIYIDLTEKNGIRPGQEFTVFRKGEVFRHPTTNQPLGRFEESLGYAQVRRVFPQFSEARYIPADGTAPARPEDGVRITRGRIKVAIAPLLDLTQSGADLRRVSYLIASALERSKRFQIADPLAVSGLLETERIRVEEILIDPPKAVRLGKRLEVTGWILPILLDRRGVSYLDATWISAVTGTALFSKRQVLTRPEPAEEQRFPWEPRAED